MGRLSNVEKARRDLEAANAGAISSDPVRTQIKQMTGFASEDELKEALPQNTMTGEGAAGPEAVPIRRPRRTKAEMEAARAKASLDVDDPNMIDPRYKRAVEEMRSGGLTTTIQAGFKTYAVVAQEPNWELEQDEYKKVDDFSYVLSKKYGVLDPTRHWLGMTFYFLALMGTLIFKRAAKMNAESWMKKLHGFFSLEETETKPESEDRPSDH